MIAWMNQTNGLISPSLLLLLWRLKSLPLVRSGPAEPGHVRAVGVHANLNLHKAEEPGGTNTFEKLSHARNTCAALAC